MEVLDFRTDSKVHTQFSVNCQKQHNLYHSGELAKLSGVSADTIRYYEKLGLLPKPLRTESRYRLYPWEASARVQVIRSALKVGFNLAEWRRYLESETQVLLHAIESLSLPPRRSNDWRCDH